MVLVVFYFIAGIAHAKPQGSIYGWGRTKLLNGQTLTQITKIAAGNSHSLVLKADGTIVGLGDNYFGQATPPAGHYHGLALKSDGAIICWGRNNYGQTISPESSGYVAIAAKYDHSLALKADGSIVGWGDNEFGQATPPAGNDFIAIAAGGAKSLAIRGVCTYSLAGDVNKGCRVNLVDFAALADNWLVNCYTDPDNPACVPME